MPPKRGNAKLKQNVEEGLLGKTDNGLKLTSWGTVNPINQKNFYTEYLKRDDQIWSNRQVVEDLRLAKDAAKAAAADKAQANGTNGKLPVSETASRAEDEDTPMDEDSGSEGQKVIVIHPGSRNLRIGIASDAFPKTIPNCIARFVRHQPRVGDPLPKRQKLENGEVQFDEQFDKNRIAITQDFRARMRYYKRRLLPNAAELVVSFNSTSQPEIIPEHNDMNQVEWTDTSRRPKYLIGNEALMVNDPRYQIQWPMRYGGFNERDYVSPRQLLNDITAIICDSIINELGVKRNQFSQYSVVLMIPDLYDKIYVREMVDLLMGDLSFAQVAILQESVAATFGAGMSAACVVDVGAQKTSICCVDEGLCVPDSRINMKYGGDDITVLYTKLLLRSRFPYQEVDLAHMYDWMLIQDLKAKFCTLNDADVNVQLYHFYQRAPQQRTKKYTLKVYDEVVIAPMAYFYPHSFENEWKAEGRYSLMGKSVDIYDGTLNNPKSLLLPPGTTLVPSTAPKPPSAVPKTVESPSGTPGVGTPTGTPAPAADGRSEANVDTLPAETSRATATPPVMTASSEADGTPQPQTNGQAYNTRPRSVSVREEAEKPEGLAFAPLDHAIIRSITEGCKGDEDRIKRMYMNILVVGSGASFPGFSHLVEERLRYFRPGNYSVTLTPPPREMDPQMLVWKGASVFSKLQIASESWIKPREWDALGFRCLQYKVLFVM